MINSIWHIKRAFRYPNSPQLNQVTTPFEFNAFDSLGDQLALSSTRRQLQIVIFSGKREPPATLQFVMAVSVFESTETVPQRYAI